VRERPLSDEQFERAALTEFLAAKEAARLIGPSFDEVLEVFRRWLYLPDPGALKVVAGAVAANMLPGDPVWLLLVAPPGGGKTELLAPLARLPRVHLAATLTEAALLSGTPKRDKADDARGGLLRVVGAFGILILKDFGSILSMNRDVRAAVLAALREVYDGSWTRHVGTDGGRTLHWAGKCGLLAGCTPTIDRHHAVMAAMGERFLLYRMPPLDPEELAERALSHPGKQRRMRQELGDAVERYFARIEIPGEPPALTGSERELVIAVSTFVARARSSVERDGYSREVELVPDAEAPGRLAIALAQLLAGLKVVGVAPADIPPLIAKVGLDCIPALRRRVLEALMDERAPLTTSKVAERIEHPTATARRALEELTAHRIVTRSAGGQGKPDEWTLSEWAEMRLHSIEEVFPKCQ